MDPDRLPPPPARVPRQPHRTPAEDDRLVEAARHDRLHSADADPIVRLLAALRTAGEVRGGGRG